MSNVSPTVGCLSTLLVLMQAKQVRSKVPWLELQQEQEKFRKDKDMLKAARESLVRLQAEQQGMSEPFK